MTNALDLYADEKFSLLFTHTLETIQCRDAHYISLGKLRNDKVSIEVARLMALSAPDLRNLYKRRLLIIIIFKKF